MQQDIKFAANLLSHLHSRSLFSSDLGVIVALPKPPRTCSQQADIAVPPRTQNKPVPQSQQPISSAWHRSRIFWQESSRQPIFLAHLPVRCPLHDSSPIESNPWPLHHPQPRFPPALHLSPSSSFHMMGKPMKRGRIIIYGPAMPLRDKSLPQQASSASLTRVVSSQEKGTCPKI